MPLTTLMANTVLDSLLGTGTPTEVEIGLSTTKPTDTGGNVTEPPIGNAYARDTVPNDAATWPGASGRSKTCNVEVQFDEATGAWGTVGWFMIYNADTTAMIGWGTLTSTVNVPTGAQIYFPIGSLTLAVPSA